MASSTQYGGATAAPPPTPSSQTNDHFSSPDAADLLSRLLHRLPPTLSLPARRSPSSASAPPTISLNSSDDALLSQLGYFQLVDHPIPSRLARSAESESAALFNLTREKKRAVFASSWPVGFDCEEDDDENVSEISESFCVDASSAEAATELDLSSLAELTRELEKIGLETIALLSGAAGFENPTRNDPSKICSLMWVSAEKSSSQDQVNPGRVYPYVVGLTYQLRAQQKYSLLGDSGWVTVSPQVDSVLVTVGDIAQVSSYFFKTLAKCPI
uniref:Non-haem dioxygenase N-terminal domain-containing protein n=1 Tax=Kalanchoe fedtschenkoi TaxID=63787 RepID=A0A7N0UAJ2_KALFE